MYHFHSLLLEVSCCIVIYTSQQHNIKDGCMKDNAGRIKDAGRKTQEDFFRKIFTSHFICKVCMWEVLETEHKHHILTPLLWPSRCLVLLMLGSTPSGLSEDPSVGCGLPYHLWSLAVWKSAREGEGNLCTRFTREPSCDTSTNGICIPKMLDRFLEGTITSKCLSSATKGLALHKPLAVRFQQR